MDKLPDNDHKRIPLSSVVIARAKATLQRAEMRLQRTKELVDQSMQLNPPK